MKKFKIYSAKSFDSRSAKVWLEDSDDSTNPYPHTWGPIQSSENYNPKTVALHGEVEGDINDTDDLECITSALEKATPAEGILAVIQWKESR